MARHPDSGSGEVTRILVALNAVCDSRGAIERAASLASALHAELAGMFVEDLDLLHMCDLPGREVLSSGAVRSTDRGEMERQLQASAAAARQALEQVATAQRLRWSFEVRRARLLEAVQQAAQMADLVAAELAGPALQAPVTSAARPRQVLAYFEGGERGARVLALAVRAAVGQGAPLVVLVPAGEAGDSGLLAEARALLRNHELAVQLERIAPGAAALQRRLRGGGLPLLFMQVAGGLVASGQLPAVVSATGCEVVLVSEPRAAA